MRASDIIHLLRQNYEGDQTCYGSVSMKDSLTAKWNVHLYYIILTPRTLQCEKEDNGQRDWQGLASSYMYPFSVFLLVAVTYSALCMWTSSVLYNFYCISSARKMSPMGDR